MGNHPSKEQQAIDGGKLKPFGLLYPNATQDYDQQALRRAITERRLCPFYLGLESENDFVPNDAEIPKSTSLASLPYQKPSSISSLKQLKRNITSHTPEIGDSIRLWKDPIECPICFLVIMMTHYSIIPEISITRDVASNQSVLIALFKSKGMMFHLIQLNVHTAFNPILVSFMKL